MKGELQRTVIHNTISEVCKHKRWELKALNVRSNHVHAVVTGDAAPERMMNAFKSWSTRRMEEAGAFSVKTKAWSRHGSTRYL